jgi:hypothetical protein
MQQLQSPLGLSPGLVVAGSARHTVFGLCWLNQLTRHGEFTNHGETSAAEAATVAGSCMIGVGDVVGFAANRGVHIGVMIDSLSEPSRWSSGLACRWRSEELAMGRLSTNSMNFEEPLCNARTQHRR